MGRYNFRAQDVHKATTALLESRHIPRPPPWHAVMSNVPPPQRLTRPVLQFAVATKRNTTKKKKKIRGRIGRPSQMFQPAPITYAEDALRTAFFGDHPWELARPRVVMEKAARNDFDWSRGIYGKGGQVDGESVVQRQLWLMNHKRKSSKEAYDIARKEFYAHRQFEDIERRIAREEARSTGAVFGKGALEVGMELEAKEFERWREWAREKAAVSMQAASASTNTDM